MPGEFPPDLPDLSEFFEQALNLLVDESLPPAVREEERVRRVPDALYLVMLERGRILAERRRKSEELP